MNVLSLDAPLVAVVWQDFLARCTATEVSAAGRWALFLAVWAVYIADRLMDARGPRRWDETSRHRFYRQNSGPATVFLAVVVAVDLVVALRCLPAEVLRCGVAVGAAVVCYLASFVFRQTGGLLWKRFCAALLFAAGTFAVAWTRMAAPWHGLGAPAAAFGALCLGNMALIERREQDRAGRGWVWMILLAALCVVAACVLAGRARWYGVVAVDALGLAAVEYLGAALPREASAVAADLILLTPFFLR